MRQQFRQRAYINAVRLLGGFILATSLMSPKYHDLPIFGMYFGAAVLLSILKLKLPGLTGSVSLNTIPLLVGIAELDSTQSVLIGCVGTLVQSFWHAKKRPSWLRLSFNLAVIVIAVNSSAVVFRSVRAIQSASPSVAFAALALTFFTMDTLPVCTAIALTERKRLVDVWREAYASSFHLFMMGATVAGIFATSGESKWIICAAILPLFYLVYRAYWLFLARMEEEKNHAAESASLNLRTMEALVSVIQARDGATDDDDKLVQTYSVAIAKHLNLPENELRALAAAALLRDIGKISIPDHLLSRPGQLTPVEMERVKKHVIIGADVLTRVNFPFPVVPIVRAHHEKWDGTGYPEGLKAEEIPLGARILAAVDALMSMTSDRPHRPALPFDEAIGIIASEANRSFDPKVVAAIESKVSDMRVEVVRAKEKSGRRLNGAASPEVSEEPAAAAAQSPLQSITRARREDEFFEGTNTFLTLKESLAVFAIRLSNIVRYDSIAIYSQVGERLVPEYATGEDSRLLGSTEIPVGEGVSGLVAQTGKANRHANPADDTAALLSSLKKMRSAVSVPIESAMGRRGVLTLYSLQKDAFSIDDLRVLLAVRLKVLDWELHSLASATLLTNLGAAIQDESPTMSLLTASK
jgi:HD-GYP domain-containing protein (c-di-GMP phosphodiesterase class II)/putative methionine-R-sulfoxide reductase with GAF domain